MSDGAWGLVKTLHQERINLSNLIFEHYGSSTRKIGFLLNPTHLINPLLKRLQHNQQQELAGFTGRAMIVGPVDSMRDKEVNGMIVRP